MLTDKTTTTVREGNGSEENPYRSPDKTAGIQTQLAALASRGGLLNLESARYDIEKSIVSRLHKDWLCG